MNDEKPEPEASDEHLLQKELASLQTLVNTLQTQMITLQSAYEDLAAQVSAAQVAG